MDLKLQKTANFAGVGMRGPSVERGKDEKGIIHFCANKGCKVPSCAVCLQLLDMFNPSPEVKRLQPEQGLKNITLNLGGGPQLTLGSLSPPQVSRTGPSNFTNPTLDIKMNQKLNSWMSWCQTCHHGGHAGCLSEWFVANTVCPVSDCSCECSNL